MAGFNLQAFRFDKIGPVATRYLWDRTPVAAIMGPQGSAKTSVSFARFFYRAWEKPPSPIDGVRRYKAGVVRDSYPNLDSTTIPSWMKLFGELPGFTWSTPRTHTLNFDFRDMRNGRGEKIGRVSMLIEFRALGDLTAEAAARGWEGDDVHINEADKVPREVLTQFFGRVRQGRYPGGLHGVSPPGHVTLDYNAPDIDHWLYELFEEEKPGGYRLYRQPGGRTAFAENRHNLAANFYTEIASGQKDWWVRRMIDNEYGYSREGTPVYRDFSDPVHVPRDELAPVPGLKLIIGADGGGTPAAIVCQVWPNGQHVAIDELVAPADEYWDAEYFGGKLLALLGGPLYADWREALRGGDWRKAVSVVVDPATKAGDDEKTKSKSWKTLLKNRTKLPVKVASTNDPNRRQKAVRTPMTRLVDGGKPGLMVSPRCKVLRKAYNSGYHFKRTRGEDGILRDAPAKNIYSHPADGHQYAELEMSGVERALDEDFQAQRRRQADRYDQGYDPYT